MVISCSDSQRGVRRYLGGTRAQADHLAPARSERAENPQG